jgi:hypothetical protein
MRKKKLHFSDGSYVAQYIPGTKSFAVQGLTRAIKRKEIVSRRSIRLQGKAGKLRLTSKPII